MTIYNFNGSANDILHLEYDVRHALTGNMEVEIVCRPFDTNPGGTLFSFGGYDNSGSETPANNILYSLAFGSGRTLNILHEYGNGNKYQASGTTALPLEWVRIKMVRTGLTYSIYVNGSLYMQSSFASNQTPSFGTNVGSDARFRVGAAYYTLTSRSTLTRASIAYIKMKNASDQVVLEFGEDPGGAPGTLPPFTGGKVMDFFHKNVERPVQTKVGEMGFDPYGGNFERPPQRGTGYILDMTGSGGGGGESEPIQTPRAYPLESSWKKANPSAFTT